LDSWPGTVGSSDNAAGCAVVLEAVKWFASHPPQKTVRFVWFTGEELDRRGSIHFVASNRLEPRAVKLFVNVDGGFEQGCGKPYVRISPERMTVLVHSWLTEPGLEMQVVYTSSADVGPFQNKGIPTFWITGSAPPACTFADRSSRLYCQGQAGAYRANLN